MLALPDFLTKIADGEILVAGHRIGLYHLVAYYNEGESAEMLASRYPTLSLSLVHRIIAFYLDNQSAVDAYIASCSSVIAQQSNMAQSVDVSALRKRLSGNSVKASATETQIH